MTGSDLRIAPENIGAEMDCIGIQRVPLIFDRIRSSLRRNPVARNPDRITWENIRLSDSNGFEMHPVESDQAAWSSVSDVVRPADPIGKYRT